MLVVQAIDIAKEWVEAYGNRVAGFAGAHLVGRLTTLPKDALFPLYSDVDLNIVIKNEKKIDIQHYSYKGLLLECDFYDIQEYVSPEKVLSSGTLAPNFVTDSVIADPEGILKDLHQIVAKEYARRRWVQARCDNEMEMLLTSIADMSRPPFSDEILLALTDVVGYMTGLIALASLKPPTHRRGLILMKEVLSNYNCAMLHTDVLSLLGCSDMSEKQVQIFLQETVAMFDRAVEVYRTPFPYGFKLRTYVRPYLVEGSREMIEEGNHREAMWWITKFLVISNIAIQNDALEEEKRDYQTRFNHLLTEIGLGDHKHWEFWLRRAKKTADSILTVVNDIISQNPEIVD